MKLHERINYILLGTLWCMATVLVLDFTLNTLYNFNMFSSTHWQYVATAQVTGQQIDTGFYIAITLAIIMAIFGLYALFRPRFRKIIIPSKNTQPTQNVAPQTTEPQPKTTNIEPAPVMEQTQTTPTTPTPMIQRTPRLHIQMPLTTPPHKKQDTSQQQHTKQSQKTETKKPRYMHEIREIFEKNYYTVLNPKKISNTEISLIALGANETLWLGASDISHEQMANVMLAFQSVFQETLEDIEIDINAFIINPTDSDHVDAILDFASLDELSNTINENPNEPESDTDDESENMDAFRGYIETVITYLGNK